MKFVLLLGGSLTLTPRLKEQVAGARVIAADGGMAHAAVLSVTPELWVGDFDSATPQLLKAQADVPRQTHPVSKDQTDGQIAVQAALARGATRLVLVGATGGQTDHALANLLLGLKLARDGLSVLMTSGLEETYPLLPGKLELDVPTGSRFSLVAFSDLGELSISGAQWPLNQANVPLGSTWTLSNLALATVRIELRKGYGAVFAYPKFHPTTW
ncbi:MAG: thiamine diphosphokinase [Thermaceae bacterium]|nr:thiamine diphosphokinase [Thermaceae bacterium]